MSIAVQRNIVRRVSSDRNEGTSLQGYVIASYAELCQMFGQPESGAESKTRAQWTLQFAGDNRIATIYDWKRAEPLAQLQTWNVGGMDRVSLRYVQMTVEAIRAYNAAILATQPVIESDSINAYR